MLGRIIDSLALLASAYLIRSALNDVTAALRSQSVTGQTPTTAYAPTGEAWQGPAAVFDDEVGLELDPTPVAEEPVVESQPEPSPVAEEPVVESQPEPAPVAEEPVVELQPESAPVLRIVPDPQVPIEVDAVAVEPAAEPFVPFSNESPLTSDPTQYDALADALAKAAAEYEAQQLLTGKVKPTDDLDEEDEGPRYRAAGWGW